MEQPIDSDGFDRLVESLVRDGNPHSLGPSEDAALAEGVSDAAAARRKEQVARAAVRSVKFNAASRNPKQAFRVVLCRLLQDPQDAAALDYISLGLKFREKGDTFGKSSLSRIYRQFGDCLQRDTLSQLHEEVTTYEGFLQGGTENHVTMRRTAGFLFGERLPDAMFHHGLTGRELAEECLRYMRDYGQTVFRNSMVEYLSPIYHAVHTAAWLNIVDFAEDVRAKMSARAILDWMLADLAANSQLGIILPPSMRAKGLMTDSYMLSRPRANTQWTGWLYWGAGTMAESQQALEQTDDWKQGPLMLHAVSDYVPEPVIRNLGAKRVATPYRLWQSRANWEVVEATQINPYGKTGAAHRNEPNPRYHVRSVYVDRHYALGAGARCADITDPVVRHGHSFAVVWRDASPGNWLFFVHPYWYTARKQAGSEAPLGLDDWSGTSPFFQMVHWENSAVLLFDLPETDPYAGTAIGSNPKWLSERAEKITRRVHAYVPETMAETMDAGKDVFLRAGDVYIGIRPIGGRIFWEKGGREGYRRLVIEGDVVGAAVEVGDRSEFGSFARFQEKVGSATLDESGLRAEKRVRYHSTRGHLLDIRHNPDDWRPIASVNGTALEYDRWPTCERPYLTCREGVMDVNDGRQGFTVDWRGDLPEYEYYDLVDGDRQSTRREHVVNGQLVVES